MPPRRNTSALDGRRKSSSSARNQQQLRQRIAQQTAELILNHGIDDWQYAKRKAARQLLLPENSALPDNEEIEAALFERQALFGAHQEKSHEETLRDKRQRALTWMQKFRDFSPRLYGALAEGWGGENQIIRIELISDDLKAVEITLINFGFRYHNTDTAREDTLQFAVYENDREGEHILLRVVTPQGRHQRKQRHVFLDQDALAALLDPRGD